MDTWRILRLRLVAACLRALRFERGRARLSNHAVRKTREYGTRLGQPIVTTQFGFKMELHLHDWGDQHVYAMGTYEEATARTMAALLRPGDACIDVGANIGFFTLLMARRVGPQGSVWAFEPSPQIRARLRRNIELNGLTNVTVRDEALSDTDGSRRFFGGSDDHSGLASLRPLAASNGTYEVRTAKLTSCIPPSLRPRLIKIDIEGAEHLAALGMHELLAAQQPDLILEVTDAFLRELGSSAPELHAFLRGLGYAIYVIDGKGLIACPRWHDALPEQFNALCTTRSDLGPADSTG